MTNRQSKPVAYEGDIMRAEAEVGNVLQLALAEDASAAPGYALDPELLQENLIIGFNPASEDVHSFYMLRSQLWKHAKETGQRIFAVTSAQPGNGKTHIAANLAAAFSRIHPTVLIELDLRRPSFGERLGLPDDHIGIDDYLAGTAALAAAGIPINGFDLTIYRSRREHGDAEMLLASTRLEELTAALRNTEGSPICIVDTPPAVVHDDMMRILPKTDGVIMVVQEGRTSKRVLSDAVQSISPTPIIGTILNLSISNPKPFSEYKSYYYRKHNTSH